MDTAGFSFGSIEASMSEHPIRPDQIEGHQQYDLDLRYLGPLATSVDSNQAVDRSRPVPGVAHDDGCLDDCDLVGVYHGQNSFIHHQRAAPLMSVHSRNRHSVAHFSYPYVANTSDGPGYDLPPNTAVQSGALSTMYPNRAVTMQTMSQAARGVPATAWSTDSLAFPQNQQRDVDCVSQTHGSGCCDDSKCEPGEPCTGTSCASEDSACFDDECAVAATPGRNREIVSAAAALASFGSLNAQPVTASWATNNTFQALQVSDSGFLDDGLETELMQSEIDEICRHLLNQHADPDASSCIRPCMIDNSNFFGSCHLTQPGFDSLDASLFSAQATKQPGLLQHPGNGVHQHSLDCGASIRNGDDLIKHFNREHRSLFPGSMPPPPPPPLLHADSSTGSLLESMSSSTGATPDAVLRDDLSAGTDNTNTPLSMINDNEDDQTLSYAAKQGQHAGPTAHQHTYCCQWRSNPQSSICNMVFADDEELFQHIKDCHIRTLRKDENGFHCGWQGCSREDSNASGFPQRSKIERHMQTHAGYKPYKCPYCPERCSAKQALEQHIRRHNGERPLVCDYPGCGKTFCQNSALTMHKRTHTGEKPLVCEICGKRFPESSNLSKHRRTHESRGRYKCAHPGCSKEFHRQDQLRRHMKQHPPERNVAEDVSKRSREMSPTILSPKRRRREDDDLTT